MTDNERNEWATAMSVMILIVFLFGGVLIGGGAFTEEFSKANAQTGLVCGMVGGFISSVCFYAKHTK